MTSVQTWFAAMDELYKIAVSVQELQELHHRLPIVRTRESLSAIPTRAQGTAAGMQDTSHLKGIGGVIQTPKGGATGHRKVRVFTQPPRTAEGQKAFNLLGVGHEALERRVRAKDIMPFAGHASPRTLLDEHNLLRSYYGPGSGEAVGVMKKYREAKFDSMRMRDLVGKALGVDYVHGEGGRVTKAMKKAIMRATRRH
jgi:hypothetical protein